MRARAKTTTVPLRGVGHVFGIASDIADTLTSKAMQHDVVMGAHRVMSGEVQVISKEHLRILHLALRWASRRFDEKWQCLPEGAQTKRFRMAHMRHGME
jgi:hypothetical protein